MLLAPRRVPLLTFRVDVASADPPTFEWIGGGPVPPILRVAGELAEAGLFRLH